MPSNQPSGSQNRAAHLPPDDEAGVVCPLKNHDQSSCRKRCTGDKRFRSMQEHIRRAHPEYYIPKLPATRESFLIMINTEPHPVFPPPTIMPPRAAAMMSRSPGGRLAPAAKSGNSQTGAFYQHHTGHSPLNYHPTYSSASPLLMPSSSGLPGALEYGGIGSSALKNEFSYSPMTPRTTADDPRRGSMTAAEVLTSLGGSNRDMEWTQDQEYDPDPFSDTLMGHARGQIDPPTDPRLLQLDERQAHGESPQRSLLHSAIQRTPPSQHRSSTLPPVSKVRPRKSSVTQNARRPRHERKTSKDASRRMSIDRKAMSAEPSSLDYGKRWADLIDAAASANEEDSRDMTPIPGSPHIHARQSLPPLLAPHHAGSQPLQHHQAYTASPLQRALTPPPQPAVAGGADMLAYPSVESSATSSRSGNGTGPGTGNSAVSGSQFHMPVTGLLSDSSPSFSHHHYPHHAVHDSGGASAGSPPQQQQQQHQQHQNQQHGQPLFGLGPETPTSGDGVQIYCAGCKRPSLLTKSLACVECICGLCKTCVEAIIAEQSRSRLARCPNCGGIGGRFKPFRLDLR